MVPTVPNTVLYAWKLLEGKSWVFSWQEKESLLQVMTRLIVVIIYQHTNIKSYCTSERIQCYVTIIFDMDNNSVLFGEDSKDNWRNRVSKGHHLKECCYLKNNKRSSLVAEQVKDLVWSLLWRGFNPWPRNFHMLWAQPKERRRDRQTERKEGRREGGKEREVLLVCGLFSRVEIRFWGKKRMIMPQVKALGGQFETVRFK